MKKLPNVLEMTFRAGHALIVGHKPTSVGLKCIGEACADNHSKERIEKFGLFDSSTPNYTTYYPEANTEDWTPKDSDFIEPVFRLLSETVLINRGIPIDFSKKGVLAASQELLIGATINPDHETALGNAMGTVSQVSWQKASTQDGVKVPAGINGVLKIDAKSNPRIARGINMDPPSIHSASVTVRFEHTPSHKLEDFWEKIGTYDDKGELIRIIVTKIQQYKELSLVGHGADPYAQKVDSSGRLNNPGYADRVYTFSADSSGGTFTIPQFYDYDYKLIYTTGGTSTGSFGIDTNHNSNLNNNDMKFTEFLVALGLAEDAYADMPAFLAHYQEVTGSHATLEGLLAIQEDLTPDSLQALSDNQRVEGEVVLEEGQEIITEEQSTILNKVEELGGLDNLDSNAALGVTYLNTIRAKAVADYKAIHGEAADEKIIENINKADLDTAKSFESSYHAELEKLSPLVCQECSSTNVQRKSTGTPKEPIKPKTHKELKESFAKKTRKPASSIHGKPLGQD